MWGNGIFILVTMSEWTRKIQRMGPGSIGVTLPQPWIREKNLEKGEEVKLSDNQGNITVEVVENGNR